MLDYENGTPFSYLFIRQTGGKMKVKPMAELVDFCQKYADSVGCIVVDAEFKQGKNPSLTIYIDRQGGVDLNLCEAFHRAIYDPIDEFDPTFGERYTLNVSSLGADRPFKTDDDFNSHIGEKVEVKLYASIKGKKSYDGILESYNGKQITIRVNDKDTFTVDLKNVVKINEYIDF